MISHSKADPASSESVARVHDELFLAQESVRADRIEAGFDAYCRALGFSLQLGPNTTMEALIALLGITRELCSRGQQQTLSALGPAVVDLTDQVCRAGALPPSAGMAAWAEVASELGALIGQLGLGFSLPSGHGRPMMRMARERAVHLNEATQGALALTSWFDDIATPG